MKKILESKKFWMSVATTVLIGVSLVLGLDVEKTLVLGTPFLSYILGQGIADINKKQGGDDEK